MQHSLPAIAHTPNVAVPLEDIDWLLARSPIARRAPEIPQSPSHRAAVVRALPGAPRSAALAFWALAGLGVLQAGRSLARLAPSREVHAESAETSHNAWLADVTAIHRHPVDPCSPLGNGRVNDFHPVCLARFTPASLHPRGPPGGTAPLSINNISPA